MTKYECESCKCFFTTKTQYNQHMKSRKHIMRTSDIIHFYQCDCCGKKYEHKKSLLHHKKKCTPVKAVSVQAVEDSETVEEMREKLEQYEQERIQYKKEHDEMKAQIALLLERTYKGPVGGVGASSGPTTMNHHTTNNDHSTNLNTTNNTNSNNNIGTQIVINAFGNENTDYLDTKAIVKCINEVYKSIPAIVETIHFNPKHPENHNIKIPNKKQPYATVMGNDQKWKYVDRKDAIDKMIDHGYTLLDGTYRENRDRFPPRKQDRFEAFQDKYENEDKNTLRNVKNDVELLVFNGQAHVK